MPRGEGGGGASGQNIYCCIYLIKAWICADILIDIAMLFGGQWACTHHHSFVHPLMIFFFGNPKLSFHELLCSLLNLDRVVFRGWRITLNTCFFAMVFLLDQTKCFISPHNQTAHKKGMYQNQLPGLPLRWSLQSAGQGLVIAKGSSQKFAVIPNTIDSKQ